MIDYGELVGSAVKVEITSEPAKRVGVVRSTSPRMLDNTREVYKETIEREART